MRSEACGCFYCLETFRAREIQEWTDEVEGVGQTAICPHCDLDTVIGSASGYPIEADFLRQMRAAFFGTRE